VLQYCRGFARVEMTEVTIAQRRHGELRSEQQAARCALPINRPQPGSFDRFAAVNERIRDFALIENERPTFSRL
jgi:hypothetical protein